MKRKYIKGVWDKFSNPFPFEKKRKDTLIIPENIKTPEEIYNVICNQSSPSSSSIRSNNTYQTFEPFKWLPKEMILDSSEYFNTINSSSKLGLLNYPFYHKEILRLNSLIEDLVGGKGIYKDFSNDLILSDEMLYNSNCNTIKNHILRLFQIIDDEYEDQYIGNVGRLVVITDDKLYMSTPYFTGDILECDLPHITTVNTLLDLNNINDYSIEGNLNNQTNSIIGNPLRVLTDRLEEIFPLDLSKDYRKRFISKYLYVKNLSAETVVITTVTKENVFIKPGGVLIFSKGDKPESKYRFLRDQYKYRSHERA